MTKEQFLSGMDNACNHRILLWEALQLTDGKVIEFGSGHGSTPFLRAYCEAHQREFESYENNPVWAEMTGSTLVDNWDEVVVNDCDVLFIDHAPGERRKIDIVKHTNSCKIMVIHDTEPAADHGYQMRHLFKYSKYAVEYRSEGAWATMISNEIDLTVLVGDHQGPENMPNYTISQWSR
jgi:hypothetical protein